jgi:DNA-binding CsgD family transcriptional regulator
VGVAPNNVGAVLATPVLNVSWKRLRRVVVALASPKSEGVEQTGRVPNVVRVASETFVGRTEELRSALGVLRGLRTGHPGVIMVSGLAGIGKTRYVSTLADRLRADGVRVMIGACLDLGAGAPPYSALIAAFRSADPPAVHVLDALTGAVDMRRSRLFELLRSTTVALAQRRPTVLIVEDLQWLDRITRDALLYLTGMARVGRWALVVTYRDDEVAARPAVREFLEVLQRDASLYVSLDALPLHDVAAQIAGIVGTAPTTEYTEHIQRRSGGVPLLVEEVLAAERAGTFGVPDHLRDLFLARVRRLGARTTRAVQAVALVGERCTDRMIAEVLRMNRTEVTNALEHAVLACVLIADDKGYRMRHDLLRDAVYGAISAARRRQLHAQIATVLAAASHPDPAALTHHWYEADEPALAARASLDAATLAERVHAPAEVHAYLERVLELFDALPAADASAAGGRGSLLARAAEAAYLSGEFNRAVKLAKDSLGQHDEPGIRALRLERLARYCWVSGDGAGVQRAQQESIAALGEDAPPQIRARVLSGYSWHLAMAGKFVVARGMSQQARDAAEATGDPLERCRALLAWGNARSDEERGLAALWQARDLAVSCDSSDELCRAHLGLALSLARLGHTAEREQVLRDGLRHVAAHGISKSYGGAMRYMLTELLLDVGRWREAEELLEGNLARGVDGVPAMFTYAYRARLAAGQGDSATVIDSADRVAALSQDLPQQMVPMAIALSARAESRLWSGAAAEAMAYAVRADAISTEPVIIAEARALIARAAADLSEWARRHGQPPAELPGAVGLAAVNASTDNPQLRSFAATIAAELSRWEGRRDPTTWHTAVAAWDEALNPYYAAYCRCRLAYALLATRAGRREAARELAIAHRTAVALLAQPLLSTIESLAATARLPIGQLGAGEVAAAAAELGFTQRELEILPLVAAGRTNPEIGEMLVISPRTVGVHVSRILHKLGVTRRTEAADIARRRGMILD